MQAKILLFFSPFANLPQRACHILVRCWPKRACHVLVNGLLLCLLCVGASAASPDWEAYRQNGDRSPNWNSFIESGFNAFDGGNWSTASNFLQRAYSKGCRDGLLLFKLGAYQEYLKEYSKAIELLKEAYKPLKNQYPDHELTRSYHEHLGRIYYETDNYKEAKPHLVTAIQEMGENFMRLFMLGQILRMEKDWSQAIKAFEKSLKYEPPPIPNEDARILVMLELMKIHNETENFDAALDYANRILSVQPQNTMAQQYRRNIEQKKFHEKQNEAIKEMIR